jgi:hypothetical protein
MTREERQALNAELAADPRIQAIVQRERRGSIPVYVNATALRALGYSVPDGWRWTSGGGGGRIQAGLFYNGNSAAGIVASLLRWWRRRVP